MERVLTMITLSFGGKNRMKRFIQVSLFLGFIFTILLIVAPKSKKEIVGNILFEQPKNSSLTTDMIDHNVTSLAYEETISISDNIIFYEKGLKNIIIEYEDGRKLEIPFKDLAEKLYRMYGKRKTEK